MVLEVFNSNIINFDEDFLKAFGEDTLNLGCTISSHRKYLNEYEHNIDLISKLSKNLRFLKK